MQALHARSSVPHLNHSNVSATRALRPAVLSRPNNSRSRTCLHALPSDDASAYKRLMMLPGGAWFMSDAVAGPVYGDSFIMSPASSQAGAFKQQQQKQHLQRHSFHQQQALVLQRAPPRGVAIRKPQPPTEIIPLPSDEVEVSIVVLPVEGKSLGIVPFKQMLQQDSNGSDSWGLQEQDVDFPASNEGSNCLAIVPRDGSTMLGVVLGSALRRRDDDLQLPVVS